MSKIIDVKFNLKYFQYEKPFHITGSVSSETKNVEVEIVTDSGIKGIGEASPSFRVNGEKVEMLMSLENIVKDMFVGLDVKEYRKIFELTSKFFATPSLKAAVEYAVLDAFAESAGVEVYQLLGGALKKIETDRTVGIDTVENRVREAKSIFDDGFKVIKIKVGENLKEDIDAMLEIHEVTRGAKYIVDANMGYSPKQAVEFA
ncbi:enolase C-terminal domain-like protein, partial [Pseudothermotoga sp.]